jgi:PAS domain S-box-containing protein
LHEVQEKEQVLSDYLEASTDFVWEVDTRGVYTYASSGVKDLLGYEPEEMIGKRPFDFMDPKEAVKVEDVFTKLVENQSIIKDLLNWNLTKEGTAVCLLTNGVPFFSKEGKFKGYRGTDKDITEEKKQEILIQTQKKEFESIFNYSKDGIAIVDFNFNFLIFNDAYLDITDYTREELSGKNCLELTIEKDRTRSIEAFELVKQRGHLENFEKTCLVKDNKQIKINLSISLLPDQKRFLLVAKDITSLKVIEEQSKLASLGEMIGNIAHQWRQPLSVISAVTASMVTGLRLGMESSKEKNFEQLKIINDQVQYLSKTIDDFRSFIKGDASILNFSIKEAVEGSFSLVEASLKNHFIAIVKDFEEDIHIRGNINELKQALINIITNAKDALKEYVEKEEDKIITVTTKKIDENRLELQIQDSAGGIDENIIDRIFEPYFTTKHKSVGTGIGLAMAYKIITERHNATIRVYNKTFEYQGKTYKGACFSIIFSNNQS